MSRSFKVPAYRLHKQSGQAVVTLTDSIGSRRDVLLGRYGTGESRAQYARVIAEWEANSRRLAAAGAEVTSLCINELILVFWEHAQQHYRREDGTHTNELNDYKLSLKPLRELYGRLPATEFSPLKLKAVRECMTAADLCRGVINQRIGRIVRMFKWAVSEELVPESVWRSLTTVRGLERGRTEARDTEPVKPVPDSVVDLTLPFALPPVRAMIELQRLTGMRPGETCALRACDLDITGDVWLYRLAHHKTRHKGKERVVAIGPRGQEIIKPFLKLETQAYLFSPREAVNALHARLRAQRKTRVQPSQQDRRKRKTQRNPGERYKTASYGNAVAKAILAANKAAACQKCKPLKPKDRCEDCKAAAIPHWHPHQLRHTHATEVRRRFGLEAAQVALGHSQAQITEVYAERDLTLAAKVAQEIG
jgi:integrase